MTTSPKNDVRNQARQEFETLSGGQKARLEIEGHNVLLLDEPTDNLDIESSESLKNALDGLEGAVITVSHDRTFLAQFVSVARGCASPTDEPKGKRLNY